MNESTRSPDDRSTAAEPHEPPPRVAPIAADDRYDVAEEISRGGMGRIRVAHDRKLERVVAVKQLLHDTAHARARFEREAKITARLQHPAIIPIYDASLGAGGVPSYSMRLVAGRSLDALIAAAATLDARLALLPNAIAVADAMAYAHSQLVIHRDLKPANVLIGDFGETVVIDWGLAKDLTLTDDPLDTWEAGPAAASPVLTAAGAVLGTPVYMAPEQARGAPVDERADVYALGALLYHLLAADPPPAALPRGVPAELIAIVRKAMAQDPARRYPSARELAADLRRFQTGQLVGAHRYGVATRIRRFVRKHRAVVGAGAILVAVLAAGAIVSVRRIQAERDVADTRLAAAEEVMQFMVSDLRDRLQALGKLELLDAVGDRVDRYYQAIDAGDRPVGEAGRRELAHRIAARQLVGEVALAKGDGDGALAASRERLVLAERLGARDLLASAETAIGSALAFRGDPAGALAADLRALGHATAAGDPWSLARAQLQLGDIYRDQGDLARAAPALEAAVDHARRAVAARPADVARHIVLGSARCKLAEVLVFRGDVAAARAMLRDSRDGLIAVVAEHPEYTEAQRALSVSLGRIGELSRNEGDLAAALAAFRASQAIGVLLAAREPANQEWQRDAAVDHQTIANVLQEQGDRAAARAELAKAKAIYERRALTAPSDVLTQADLASVATSEAVLCDDPACAARNYRRGVELFHALERRAPGEPVYPFMRIWNQLALAGQLCASRDPGALAIARDGLAAATAWAANNPSDTDGPLLVAHGQLITAQALAGSPAGAAESRRLASQALVALGAHPQAELHAVFHERTADELALATRLAR